MSTKQLDYRGILGEFVSQEEVLEQIAKDEVTNNKFQRLPLILRHELIAFCMGSRGLKITYDPFFKYIMNPSTKPGRLAELISLILDKEVEIVEVLPNESDRISDTGSLLVMDIVVKLKSGAYANVEIQKVGYSFQGERCACYSSDLLMRQLARERAKAKEEKRVFSYKNIKKVYTIVLMEKSPSEYWMLPNEYIHHGEQTFNTGLKLDLLQEYFMIPLDVFKEISHNKINKLEAWLYFLSSDSPKDIYRVVEAFPEFKEYYNELLMLRYKTKELIDMFDDLREALRDADEGTVIFMVEEQQKEIEEQRKELCSQEKVLSEQKNQITEQQTQIAEQQSQITEQQSQIRSQEAQLQSAQEENKRLKEMLRKANIKVD